MFSISFRKYRDEEKEKQLVYFDHQNVNSLCSRHHHRRTGTSGLGRGGGGGGDVLARKNYAMPERVGIETGMGDINSYYVIR